MCGICGIVNIRGKSPNPETGRRMLASLHHRGPDGSGLYIDRHAMLGHTRLSIIDLTGGAQPMSNEDETIWLSFNGEIYNYRELKEVLLTRGHTFRNSSDSEVIIHAWEEWGSDAFRRFNGQWAIALWNTRKRELVLSIDPYGIRPLFYNLCSEGIHFASEIKAILQDPSLKRELDPAGLADIYSTWGLMGTRTCFRGIQRLLPGHFLHLTTRGSQVADYRALGLTEPGMTPSGNLEDAVDQALEQAVNLRFTRSDVPVGAYLSGGLDSSITVSMIRNRTDVPLKTFSIRFGDPEFDEGVYQQALADDLGTEHHSLRVDAGDMMAVFPKVIRHTEQPVLRTAPIPMFLLSRFVRENGTKVVVTGEGADEFFAGYDIFKETALRTRILEGASEDEISALVANLYPWMVRAPGSTRGMGRGFFERNLHSDDPFMSHRTRWDNGGPILAMLHPDLSSGIEPSEKQINLPDDFSRWPVLYRSQWLEVRTLLNGYLLSAQGDRMLMSNSVEGRFPFLDPDVTTIANSLPMESKLTPGLIEKAILKRTFDGKIPERIQNRPKQPYRAPDAAAIFSPVSRQDWMERITDPSYIDSTGLFQSAIVSGLFDKCRRKVGSPMSNRDNMMAVAAVSTLLLHCEFIEDFVPANPVAPDLLIDRR